MILVILLLVQGVKNAPNHYWLFNVNIREKRFDVLDPLRLLEEKNLEESTRTTGDDFKMLCEEN